MSSLLFVDDTVKLAESAEDMKRSLQCLQSWCEKWFVEINVEECHDAYEEEESGQMLCEIGVDKIPGFALISIWVVW